MLLNFSTLSGSDLIFPSQFIKFHYHFMHKDDAIKIFILLFFNSFITRIYLICKMKIYLMKIGFKKRLLASKLEYVYRLNS